MDPAKIIITDQISSNQYVINNGSGIAQVTAIIEDMHIARQEISKERSEKAQSHYTISYRGLKRY
ncbi:MAG: hypothetical protein PHF24_02280 [Syntrophomonas sp.]|nr:hypothetical protein [Syntrophomonas sp.]